MVFAGGLVMSRIKRNNSNGKTAQSHHVNPRPAKTFLTAEWRHLVMLNYETDPRALAPHVPAGTELDTWDGRTLISVVGFLFRDTRVWGVSFPFHRDFEEVNLRFYVRRKGPEGWRRGGVFNAFNAPKTRHAF